MTKKEGCVGEYLRQAMYSRVGPPTQNPPFSPRTHRANMVMGVAMTSFDIVVVVAAVVAVAVAVVAIVAVAMGVAVV